MFKLINPIIGNTRSPQLEAAEEQVRESAQSAAGATDQASTLPVAADETATVAFEPLFMCQQKSVYRNKVSVRIGNQKSILEATSANDIGNCDGGDETLRQLTVEPEQPTDNDSQLYCLNPCHLPGVSFVGVNVRRGHGGYIQLLYLHTCAWNICFSIMHAHSCY